MGFFKSMMGSDSSVSATRVQSVLLVLVGIGIAIAGVVRWWYGQSDLAGIIGLVSTLIGFGVAGKAVQNIVTKGGPNDDGTSTPQ